MLSLSHNLLHVHIPKCAGTAVRQSLEAKGVGWQDSMGRSNDELFGAHWPAKAWKMTVDADTWDKLFKFAVIRHPGDMIVSEFHYLRDKVTPPSAHWIPPHIEFDEWMLEHVAVIGSNYIQELSNLTWWINTPLDAVYRYDELETAWEEICQRAGLPPGGLLVKNKTQHRPWQSYFEGRDDLIEIVRRRYADDFSQLGWEFA